MVTELTFLEDTFSHMGQGKSVQGLRKNVSTSRDNILGEKKNHVAKENLGMFPHCLGL